MKNQILTSLIIFLFSSILCSQNNSLNFDGTDDNVEIASSPELTPNQFTIEAWIKSNAGGTWQPIFGKYNSNVNMISYVLTVLPDNTIRFAVYEADALDKTRAIDTDNAVLTPNIWQHITASFDLVSQDLKIYVGGVESPSTLLPGSVSLASIYNGSQPAHIGKIIFNSGSSHYFNGRIDEVRFWNTERNQTEISTNLNTELTGNESGLVAYYKFDLPNSSCDIEDCNSNENHGIRLGAGGSNNLPQFSSDVSPITDISCGASTGCATLPVELIDFKGNEISNRIDLKWTTASELNNAGFEIDYSTNAKDWQSIGFQLGNGTQEKKRDYTFQHVSPQTGINYYRLKQD